MKRWHENIAELLRNNEDKPKLSINAFRLICAAVYYVLENNYFGWNKHPQSAEEVIADGIVLLILALSVSKVRT